MSRAPSQSSTRSSSCSHEDLQTCRHQSRFDLATNRSWSDLSRSYLYRRYIPLHSRCACTCESLWHLKYLTSEGQSEKILQKCHAVLSFGTKYSFALSGKWCAFMVIQQYVATEVISGRFGSMVPTWRDLTKCDLSGQDLLGQVNLSVIENSKYSYVEETPERRQFLPWYPSIRFFMWTLEDITNFT